MKLYVANCTHQMQTVNYRLIEQKSKGWSTQNIDIGRQQLIAHPNLNTPQIEGVLTQLALYGLRMVGEGWEREDIKVPLLANIDEPVPHAMMLRAIEHNDSVLTNIGKKFREEAAIAASHGMRAFSPNAADNMQMTIEEEKPGTMDHNGRPGTAEGYRMDRGFNG